MGMSKAEAGRLGGRKTVERHGTQHMSKIGQKGFDALTERLGDYGAAVSFLQSHKGMPGRPKSQWQNGAGWRSRG